MFDDETEDAVERDGGVFISRRMIPDVEIDEDDRLDFGEDRDPELWSQQRPLIEEDTAEGLRLDGFSEDVVPRIIDAMGDDVAEPLQDSPSGVSATGTPFEPDHGGFPEHE